MAKELPVGDPPQILPPVGDPGAGQILPPVAASVSAGSQQIVLASGSASKSGKQNKLRISLQPPGTSKGSTIRQQPTKLSKIKKNLSKYPVTIKLSHPVVKS